MKAVFCVRRDADSTRPGSRPGMRQTGTRALFLAAALAFACSGAFADETPVDPATIHDAAACASIGGKWLERVRLCVIAYADGGKACTDDADCQGKCLADTRLPPPASGPETGACARDSNLLGCRAEILNGVRQQAVCRD